MGKSFDCRYCHECGSRSHGFRKSHGKRGTARERSFQKREETDGGFLKLGTPASRLNALERDPPQRLLSHFKDQAWDIHGTSLPSPGGKLGTQARLPSRPRCKNVSLHQRTMTADWLPTAWSSPSYFAVSRRRSDSWGLGETLEPDAPRLNCSMVSKVEHNVT